jgi:putative hemolysin
VGAVNLGELWHQASRGPVLPLVLMAVLLGFSSLYSMGETAFMALSRARARQLSERGGASAKLIEDMVAEPNRVLGTVLVGNNLANIAASAIATALFIGAFGPSAVTVATLVMTVVILLVSEITPKTYAAHNPDVVALRLVRFLNASARLFTPVVRALTAVGVGVIRAAGGKVEGGKFVTEDEIRTLVDVGEEQGLLEAEEREMIQGIFELGDTVVREVMVPRIDIDAVEDDATLEDAWRLVIHSGHSRVPVYHDTIDDIVGVIYARDILAFIKERPPETRVAELMRPAYYVPETKKVDELLADFRRVRTHMAVVLDEYGGTAGLVTIEDLLEEIVGEIQDEYDREDAPVRQLGPDWLEADGRVTVDELREHWDIPLPDEDVDTLGGLILHLLGRAPVQGEKLRYDGLEITVTTVVGRRVKRLQIRRVPDAPADAPTPRQGPDTGGSEDQDADAGG